MYSLLPKVLPTSSWEFSSLSDQSQFRAESSNYTIQDRKFWFVPGDVKSLQMNMDNLVLF